MPSVKIVCLGGGSLYFSWFLPELPLAKGLEGSEIVLYDIDVEKTTRMAAMGQRLADTVGMRMTVRAAATLDDALDGADFAVSSIGGSGADIGKDVYYSYYHQADMHIPAKYGICQIIGDTCGPAGMMMALRSIPVYMNICRQMERRCPKALLLNHSNPMAVLMRAMHKYTSVRATGVCHGVQEGINDVAALLNVPAMELDCLWIGTNHYYWFTRIAHKGVDLTQKVSELASAAPVPAGTEMCHRLSEAYGHRIVYRSDDHIIEFYPYPARCTDPSRLPPELLESARKHGFEPGSPMPVRTEPDTATRVAFLTQYQEILNKAKPAEQLSDSFTGEGTAALIEALANSRRMVCIANVANQGAIPNLPADAEVEVQAVVDSFGARPIYMGPAPRVLKGILEKRFAWHELVADAAVKGDRNAALQALLIDEMSIQPDQAAAMLDELLAASRPLLPQFFG
jgi:alpha-galactosidase